MSHIYETDRPPVEAEAELRYRSELPTSDSLHKQLAEAAARYRAEIDTLSEQRDMVNRRIDELNAHLRRISAAEATFTEVDAVAVLAEKQNWIGSGR